MKPALMNLPMEDWKIKREEDRIDRGGQYSERLERQSIRPRSAPPFETTKSFHSQSKDYWKWKGSG
jgi:hypothetical protein